jgi:hypothetical protein
MATFLGLKKEIEKVKGTTFCGLTTLTAVTLKGGKKNEMQGRVTKKMEDANVMLFSNTEDPGYVSIVRKRMIAEGKDPDTFTPKPRAWGQRMGNSPFIEHKDKHYLECFFVSKGKVTYYLDNEEIPKEKIEGLDEKPEKTEKEIESQGGIENKVVIRTFAIESIESLKLKGKTI